MNKLIKLSITAVGITAITFAACNSPKEKVENAQEDVTNAKVELDIAEKAYLEDVEKYRIMTNERIAANEKLLADIKASIKDSKTKNDYEAKINELEMKNAEMKKKMEEYKADKKGNWETFKTELNHDMDGIGEAFKDITVKNTK